MSNKDLARGRALALYIMDGLDEELTLAEALAGAPLGTARRLRDEWASDGSVGADLGLVEAEVVFSELEAFFDWPAESGCGDEPVECGGLVFGDVAVVVGAFAGGDVAADIVADFVTGDEVYGTSPDLRRYCEHTKQGYVLRVAKTFQITLGDNTKMTCKEVIKKLLKHKRDWSIHSAGTGSKSTSLCPL